MTHHRESYESVCDAANLYLGPEMIQNEGFVPDSDLLSKHWLTYIEEHKCDLVSALDADTIAEQILLTADTIDAARMEASE